ncbi:MAG: NAD-dependent epimerase/dehydratase family protein [Candidatus Pacebacteria bacterium]|nr:NAD-dependent epimerase/dehydratase family protein [Candidatus Paceibacterota bacterium]
MKVLVTGGAGFIGSHVVDLLLKEGAEVHVFDSFITGKRERVPKGVRVIEGDIRDRSALEEAMQGMTHVVHLAALVSVPESVENPTLTHEVNVIGTRNVFDAARRAGVSKVVYASSAAVYGDHPELPKTEESPLQPKSPYATSKVANEADALASGLSTVGLRFFNVYGPRQDANHPYASVIPRWVAAAKDNRMIELHGGGVQTRDFIHVHDVARAILLALKSAYVGICNVASGVETVLQDVLQHMSEMLNKDVLHERTPARAGDISRSVARVDRARETLGFEAEIPLKKGLKDLLA